MVAYATMIVALLILREKQQKYLINLMQLVQLKLTVQTERRGVFTQ